MKVFRVIDFETTGFPPNAGIVEVGLTDLIWEGTKMEVGPTRSNLCDPGMPIDPGAKAVHHIIEEDLAGHAHSDCYLEALDRHADFIVAHNLEFESKFYHTAKPTICTLKCSRQLIDAPKYSNQYLRYFLNLPVDRERAEPAHRAGPDTYVTAILLRHLLAISAQQGGDFVGRLVKITSEVQLLTHIRFGKYAGSTFEDVARMDRKYLIWIVNNDRAEPAVKAAAQHWLNKTV